LVQVSASFNPFRLKLSNRAPVTLQLDVGNNSDEKKIVSVHIALGRQLSFEKGGYKTEETIRLPELAAGEKKRYYYEVYPKAATRLEEQPVQIKVLEHYRDFNYVKSEFTKTLGLKVES
jgi:hypothetical protein